MNSVKKSVSTTHREKMMVEEKQCRALNASLVGRVYRTMSLLVGILTVVTNSNASPRGSGGSETNVGSSYIHTFTSSGTFTLNADTASVRVLVVAGGGSGTGGLWGAYFGAGGAGGTCTEYTFPSLPAGTYTVTVGAGTSRGPAQPAGGPDCYGYSGGTSSFHTVTASGGQGGQARRGGSNNSYSGGLGTTTYGAGGGAGAGGNGSGGSSFAGGNGYTSDISGTSTTYAGGGGGADGGSTYSGGTGGGGTGRDGSGDDATSYGGGGGASNGNATGGAGKAGIVIVRYDAAGSTDVSKYVACNATDSGDGTIGSPMTIQHALDYLKSGVGRSDVQAGKIHIYFRGGTYNLSAPISLTSVHSGLSASNQVYLTPYPGEQAILSGGIAVTSGWSGGPICQFALSATQFPSTPSFRQLYLNGQRIIRARSSDYRATEMGQYAQVPGMTWNAGQLALTNPFTLKDSTRITAALQSWSPFPPGLEVVYGDQWYERRVPVIGPPTGNTVVSLGDTDIPDGNVDTIYFENAEQLLDSPGEWYFDKNTGSRGTIKMIFPEGTDSGNYTLTVPLAETLVSLSSGASDITIDGFTFCYTGWTLPSTGFKESQANWPPSNSNPEFVIPAAVMLDTTNRISVKNCNFVHLGGIGIKAGVAVNQTQIIGNAFSDISSTAISVGTAIDYTNQPALQQSGNVIQDNLIENIGTEFHGAVGIWVGYTKSTQVIHNELRNLPYTGISVGWGWLGAQAPTSYRTSNVVRGNLIEYHMQERMDGAGIYTLGAMGSTMDMNDDNASFDGMTISENVVRYQGRGYNHIYNDGGSRYIRVWDNILYNNMQYQTDPTSFNFGGAATYGNISIKRNYCMMPSVRSVIGFHGVTPNSYAGHPEWDTQHPETMVLSGNTVITNASQANQTILNGAGLEAGYTWLRSIAGRVPTPWTATPMNYSARTSSMGTGDRIVISGFILEGAGSHRLLVRALGPTLGLMGVPGTATDPQLKVYSGSTQIASNNDWGTGQDPQVIINAQNEVGAYPLINGSKDAAVLLTLAPGAYTISCDIASGTAGAGMVEIYDLDWKNVPQSYIRNVSLRAWVDSGNPLIAGFIMKGPGQGRIMARAAAQSLAQWGVGSLLGDPQISAYLLSGPLLARNLNLTVNDADGDLSFQRTLAKKAADINGFPLYPSDAALWLRLNAGTYLFQVEKQGGSDGVAMMEIYSLR